MEGDKNRQQEEDTKRQIERDGCQPTLSLRLFLDHYTEPLY